MDNSSLTDWIQAIATVVLVTVTAYYVYLTHALSREAKENRELTPLPILTCQIQDLRPETGEITPIGSQNRFLIRNVGNAPALDSVVHVSLANRRRSGIAIDDVTIKSGTLEPGESHSFDLKGNLGPDLDYPGSYQLPKFQIRMCHQNAFGRSFCTLSEMHLDREGYWRLDHETRTIE